MRMALAFLLVFSLVGCGGGDEEKRYLQARNKALNQECERLKAENELLHKPEGDLAETLKKEREAFLAEKIKLEGEIERLKTKTVISPLESLQAELNGLRDGIDSLNRRVDVQEENYRKLSLSGSRCNCHK